LGNRNITLAYNADNLVIQSTDTGGWGGTTGVRSVSHDARGNVTGLGNLGFGYDYSDQPVSVSGAVNGTYLYDGNKKRVRANTNGALIYNVYDASGALVHIDNLLTGKATDTIRAGGMTIARVENNTPVYLHTDHLGSPVAGTDTAGNVAWTEMLSPFGITANNPVANDDQGVFTGHIRDADTGLSYMQARYYDPVMGRFLSVDPVGYSGAADTGMFGRYAYTWNNPINMTDPDGKQIAPVDEPAMKILNEAFQDPNSTIAQTHELASNAGVPILVQTGGTGEAGSEVTGGLTQAPATVQAPDGTVQDAVIVTIDTRDLVIVSGIDTETNTVATRALTIGEVVEHELGIDGHAADAVSSGPTNFNGGVDPDKAVRGADRYRQNSGIPFKRQTHTPPQPGSTIVK
jgi:RHS repeat-associated protein